MNHHFRLQVLYIPQHRCSEQCVRCFPILRYLTFTQHPSPEDSEGNVRRGNAKRRAPPSHFTTCTSFHKVMHKATNYERIELRLRLSCWRGRDAYIDWSLQTQKNPHWCFFLLVTPNPNTCSSQTSLLANPATGIGKAKSLISK